MSRYKTKVTIEEGLDYDEILMLVAAARNSSIDENRFSFQLLVGMEERGLLKKSVDEPDEMNAFKITAFGKKVFEKLPMVLTDSCCHNCGKRCEMEIEKLLSDPGNTCKACGTTLL